MNQEEIVCELQRPLPPVRKAVLYATVALAGALCVFFFFAAWLALSA